MKNNKLLVATFNEGKIREYQSLLSSTGISLITPKELGISTKVEETATSFNENAKLKAFTYSKLSKLPTIADDSGLEVYALHGKPGIYSARFAGENASDAENINKLLGQLCNTGWADRIACFTCVIAFVNSTVSLQQCTGRCCGMITYEPRGSHGFGYDPVFYLLEYGKTMAELTVDHKNKISHRYRAVSKLTTILANL
jgi:XTP/dITP diphosphohydrolase